MNLIFTLVGAFPMGFLIRRRQTAVQTYLIIESFLFSFQTLNVLLTWMSGDTGLGGGTGFGKSPAGPFPVSYSGGEVTAYGVVNLVITLVGLGLVLLGARVRARRAAARGA